MAQTLGVAVGAVTNSQETLAGIERPQQVMPSPEATVVTVKAKRRADGVPYITLRRGVKVVLQNASVTLAHADVGHVIKVKATGSL